MNKFIIFKSFDYIGSDLVEMILKEENLNYSVVLDQQLTMRLTKGLPLGIVCGDTYIGNSYTDLVKYIDKEGLLSC